MNKNFFLLPGGKNELPVSAYVNSESRSETLRYYRRCFAHPDNSDFRWFNFHLDTLCLAAEPPLPFLEHLDPGDLRQLQRLIVPVSTTGILEAATPCRDTWPKPVTQSIESSMMEIILEEDFPSLKEVTLTTNQWYPPRQALSGDWRKRAFDGHHSEMIEVTLTTKHWPAPVPGVCGDEWKDYFLLERSPVRWDEGLGLGHMRTTYINGLKVRHSTAGRKTYKQRYCRQMKQQDLDLLAEYVKDVLLV